MNAKHVFLDLLFSLAHLCKNPVQVTRSEYELPNRGTGNLSSPSCEMLCMTVYLHSMWAGGCRICLRCFMSFARAASNQKE